MKRPNPFAGACYEIVEHNKRNVVHPAPT